MRYIDALARHAFRKDMLLPCPFGMDNIVHFASSYGAVKDIQLVLDSFPGYDYNVYLLERALETGHAATVHTLFDYNGGFRDSMSGKWRPVEWRGARHPLFHYAINTAIEFDYGDAVWAFIQRSGTAYNILRDKVLELALQWRIPEMAEWARNVPH